MATTSCSKTTCAHRRACDIGAVEFAVPEPAAAALGAAALLSLGKLRRHRQR